MLERPIVPPLGPKPKWVIEEERIKELKQVITNYMHANYPLPADWITEYNELIQRNTKNEEI